MVKHCPCGTQIRRGRSLCAACLGKYGVDSAGWPEWLIWAVKDEQRQWDAYRRHICREVPFAVQDTG